MGLFALILPFVVFFLINLRRRRFGQNGVKISDLGELRKKNNLVDIKKVNKIFKNFLKIHPRPEKVLLHFSPQQTKTFSEVD